MCTNRLAPFTIRRLVLRSTDDVFCGIVLRTIAFASSASLSRRRRRRRRRCAQGVARSRVRFPGQSEKEPASMHTMPSILVPSGRPYFVARRFLGSHGSARASLRATRASFRRARVGRVAARASLALARARSRRTRTGASTSARPRSASTSRAAARSVRAASGARPRVSPGTRRRNAG